MSDRVRELEELLRPVIALRTFHDLFSRPPCHRLPAGDVLVRVSTHGAWVRVWSIDKQPWEGVTVTLAELAAALDSTLTVAA